MLSALRTEDHSQVILLREDGLAVAEALRAQAREDRIVCEVCAQPVVVRAGMERTWHFAHRTRENCPKAAESMEQLACRALLFGWLRGRFPGAVQLEKVVPGLPRPVDCWVERPGKPTLAWWLVTAGIKPEVREQLGKVFRERGVLVQYVFLARMLVRDPEPTLGFILGTTEREFMRPSRYGPYSEGAYDSLHYLDNATGHLITCRGLLAVHPPQGYGAELQDHALAEVRILPSTGEFVHPGEAERLQAFQEAARVKEARREEARRAAAEAERERRARRKAEEQREARWVAKLRVSTVKAWVPATSQSALPPRPEPEVPAAPGVWRAVPVPAALQGVEVPPVPREGPIYTCRLCGGQTRDWVVLYGSTGECKCRACARGMG